MIEDVGGRNAKGRVYILGFDGIIRACALEEEMQRVEYTYLVLMESCVLVPQFLGRINSRVILIVCV